MEPEIIFEDNDILVINKPAGYIVNSADTTGNQPTIQSWIESKYGMYPDTPDSDFSKRGGIVHRLDKETSGILVIAKTQKAFDDLQKQFKERTVEKSYQALVHGRVILKEGEISVPIGRLPWNRMRFGVLADGRPSKTFYKVDKYYNASYGKKKEIQTLVTAYPKTGRTHQIRVHFQYLGNPLVSDPLYGGRKTVKRDRKVLERHFLHAKELSFHHPETQERLTFESQLPEDLSEFLKQLEESE